MEQEGDEKNRQAVLQFRCAKILTCDDEKKSDEIPVSVKTSNVEVKQYSGIDLTLLTPERKLLPPRTKKNETSLRNNSFKEKDILKASIGDNNSTAEYPNSQKEHFVANEKVIDVPVKYNLIADLFDSMECSVRLLSLKKKLPTFRNISTQVEIMTKRKFSYTHLAQMKHVFPEAFLIEKVLVHDKESLCVIPDLKVNFCPNVVQCHASQKSVSEALHQSFRSRLLDFVRANHECFDIPEASLPEPFKPIDQNLLPKELLAESSIECSHLNTFKTNFFSSVSNSCSSSSKLLSHMSSFTEGSEVKKSLVMSLPDLHNCHNVTKTRDVSIFMRKNSDLSTSNAVKSNIKLVSDVDCSIAPNVFGSTPVKFERNPCNTTVGTSVQALKTPDNTSEKLDVQDETCLTSSARRTLMFSPSKLMENAQDLVLHRQSNLISCSDYQMPTAKAPGKDEDARENIVRKIEMQDEHTGAIEQNRKHRQILTNLCSLVRTIRVIFQSISGRWITKQELMHKILYYNYNIEQTTEVEEQLHLLQSFVPDWIREKTMRTGDHMYSIDKSYDPVSVCASITETASTKPNVFVNC